MFSGSLEPAMPYSLDLFTCCSVLNGKSFGPLFVRETMRLSVIFRAHSLTEYEEDDVTVVASQGPVRRNGFR